MGWNTDAVEYFSRNEIFEGKEAVAMAYSGLEFGGFYPQLGDGRSIALLQKLRWP